MLTQWHLETCPTFHGRHFRMYYLEWRLFHCDSNFTEVHSRGPNYQLFSIAGGNGLAPILHQNIYLKQRWLRLLLTNICAAKLYMLNEWMSPYSNIFSWMNCLHHMKNLYSVYKMLINRIIAFIKWWWWTYDNHPSWRNINQGRLQRINVALKGHHQPLISFAMDNGGIRQIQLTFWHFCKPAHYTLCTHSSNLMHGWQIQALAILNDGDYIFCYFPCYDTFTF